jgi:hypothetical protein
VTLGLHSLLVYLQAHALVASPKCRNPSLGLATEARGCKVASQVGDPRAFHMLLGVQKM